MLPLILFATIQSSSTPAPARPATPAAAAAAPSLFDAVLQRMSPAGRPIFRRYLDQTLLPRVRADGVAQVQYRKALRDVMAVPTLDVDTAERLIARRRDAETGMATSIRSSAFAMIRTLPPADRRLALTAIFADTRVPAARPAPAPASAR